MGYANQTLSVGLGGGASVSVVPFAWLAAYLLVLLTSGILVTRILARAGLAREVSEAEQRVGVYIGKLENVLVITFVILGDFTALALVFAAKGIIRARDDKHASYYLLGTLVNFTWSLVVALLARTAIAALP